MAVQSDTTIPRDAPVVHVWDIPTRLFHWLLVILMITSVATVKTGNMVWHERSGIAILVLIGFRLLWGIFGGRHARFTSFIRGPGETLGYFRDLVSGRSRSYLGHNPLGALSVLALIVSVGTQAVTGLFADDAIVTQGPLVNKVSGATSTLMTRIHHYNEKVMYALVALHIGAILYYAFVKREDLVRPMVTGRKSWPHGEAPADARGPVTLAIVLLAIVIALVWGIVYRK